MDDKNECQGFVKESVWMREGFKAKGGKTFNKFVKMLGWVHETEVTKKKVPIKDPLRASSYSSFSFHAL